MALPILTHRPQATPDDLVRFYHRCELHWCGQVAEQVTLDCGTALTNPALAEMNHPNQMVDATLPPGMTPPEAVALADAHFTSQGVRCSAWVLAPAAPVEQTKPLADHLLSVGHTRAAHDILYLTGQPSAPIEEVSGLTIIPARASFRHARTLAEESGAAATNRQEFVQAVMLHLEDPSTDSLLTMKDGAAAALVSVLTVGEMGCIAELFVAEKFRRQGIGRTMMSRALEICARSLFKHVFVGVGADNAAAQALYRACGFRKIGEFISYRR